MPVSPQRGDALVIVDVQNDFLPGGALAVPRGDEVIPPLNRYIDIFQQRGLPIFATRDWHPPNHCSFREQGGRWPRHCVMSSEGANISPDLKLPANVVVISKGSTPEREAYSGFEGTNLEEKLRAAQIKRLFVGGLATDYCVLKTVLDARRLGFEVFLLRDAIRAVNAQAGDGERAEGKMLKAYAVPITLNQFAS
jgi:nicotinamidase/pyrazinamidase